MQFLEKCVQHARQANKLCGHKQCCLVFCDICFLEHSDRTGHSQAVCLTPQALTFFSTFTGYTHYKVFQWVDIVRRRGFFSLFATQGGDEGVLESSELGVLGVRVLEEFQILTQNNRQFVENNRNNAQLLHPEFLRDIFNLVTEHWAISAHLIIDNLNKLASQAFKPAKTLPRFSIQEQFLNSVESYRVSLLAKNLRLILLSVDQLRKKIKEPSQGINQILTSQPVSTKQEGEQGNYELPYSIKQIQSFEEIGERGSRPHSTICSIAYDPIVIQEVNQQPEDERIEEMAKLIEKLMSDNSALQDENRSLKAHNTCLLRDKVELQAKLTALEKANKENQKSSSNISSKDNLVLKLPARVLSLSDSPINQGSSVLTSRLGQEMFVRKVRIVK